VATLTKPAIKSLIAGKKKATVKWSRITGASGYVIYRSTKKSSGYKAVKTITKGGTVSFTNTKLKKGKLYYFKMRAYRTVSGKKVYSSYSAVKSVRVK
jgi:lactocepin